MRHEKGPDGTEMGQPHMMGQFAAQLPEMHGWNASMQTAEMYGGLRSGAPAMSPGMAGMLPAMQPGMAPNPQVWFLHSCHTAERMRHTPPHAESHSKNAYIETSRIM
jgi:hypothetical protein